MKTSLENISRNFYAFLDEHDVRVLREYRDCQSGSWVVDAVLPEFRFRVVCGRGAVTLWVGSKGSNDWSELSRVFEFVLKKPVPNDPEILTDYLRSEYSRLVAAVAGGELGGGLRTADRP